MRAAFREEEERVPESAADSRQSAEEEDQTPPTADSGLPTPEADAPADELDAGVTPSADWEADDDPASYSAPI